MFIKNIHSLSLRIGVQVVSVSLILTIIGSLMFYWQVYQSEMEQSAKSLGQLAATIESSASIAAYLGNEELGKEVVQGLINNDIVMGACIQSNEGMKIQAGDINKNEKIYKFTLLNPFDFKDNVGYLTIYPNTDIIIKYAKNAGLSQAVLLAIYSLSTLVIISLTIRYSLTTPLNKLAKAVNAIRPGQDTFLDYKPPHKKDEIGQLVEHSNFMLQSMSDILKREQNLRAEVLQMGQRFRLLFEQAGVGIVLVNPAAELIIFNSFFEELIGQDRLQLAKHKGLSELFNDPQTITQTLNLVLENQLPTAGDFELCQNKDTNPRWFHCLFSFAKNEAAEKFVEIIVHDISQRMLWEKKVTREARRDSLTNLYNRRSGEKYAEEFLLWAKANKKRCVFFMVDLDKFKPINDTYGHEAGDKVLIEVAHRLLRSVRADDLVMRRGGDEFLIVMKDASGNLDIDATSKKMLKLIAKEIGLENGKSCAVGASIGISIFPDHGHLQTELIAHADAAMYLIKEAGRNAYCIYDTKFVKSNI